MHSQYAQRQAIRSSATHVASSQSRQKNGILSDTTAQTSKLARTHVGPLGKSGTPTPKYSINLSLFEGRVVPVHTINVHSEVNVQHQIEVQFILIRLNYRNGPTQGLPARYLTLVTSQ